VSWEPLMSLGILALSALAFGALIVAERARSGDA
jgi:hypothetical protein